MSDIRVAQMLPHALSQNSATRLYGQVLDTAVLPAPAAFTDPLYVVIPDIDPNGYWVFDSWPQMHGGTLPTGGTECMLEYDNRRNLRCTWIDGQFSTYAPAAL